MTAPLSFGAAQSKLLSLLDDATRKAVADGKNGVALSGAVEDLAVLGFMSLYRTDPVHSYALSNDRAARAAALRFGALHQTCPADSTSDADTLPALAALAQEDGCAVVTGHMQDLLPTPLADPALAAFWQELPSALDRDALMRAAVWPLLGKSLVQGTVAS